MSRSLLNPPWWAKIGLKLLLSRLPIDYAAWKRLGIFKHGDMESANYAWNVFLNHFSRTPFSGKQGGYTCLEIGPGDSLSSCLIAHAQGADRCYLLDAGAYASRDMARYRDLAQLLAGNGKSLPERAVASDVSAMLQSCNALYLTDGLRSMKQIPDASVDWIWSHAVLEHIRKREFPALLTEMKRVLKPGGGCSHRIDLRDHLGGALNNLRFSERIWEADWMARSGFYTNRIRYQEMLAMFAQAGFQVTVLEVDRWRALPTDKLSMHPLFRPLPDEDLCVSGFDVLLAHSDVPPAQGKHGDR